jgi:hypothetical protein
VIASRRTRTQYRFQGVDRIVVFADVHGAYPQLLSILRETGVIDRALHWQGGKTHLVGIGDSARPWARNPARLRLLMRLESEAHRRRGAVARLLGNHEV